MFKNVASQKIAVYAFDATTGVPKTGDAANLTAYVSKDFGSVTVLADTSATEMDATNAKGMYLFDVAQAESNADCAIFTAKSTTANIYIAPQTIYTDPPNYTTLSVDGSGRVDVIKIAGTTQTARDIGASVITASGTVTTVSGNVNGSVGSVTGAVGSVTGLTASNLDATISSVTAKTNLIPGTQDGKTFAQTTLLMASALLGKASGMATTTAVFRAVDDSKDRITATVDANGNRSAVTLDAT